jgi:hypothetical protein
MITLSYSGGLGNQLWQYTTSRIFAEKNDLLMLARQIPNFPNATSLVRGNAHLFPRKRVLGHFLPEDNEGVGYRFKGQFERFEYLIGNEEKAKLWATPIKTTMDKPDRDDLVISIRRGWKNWPADTLCPSIEYYVKLIENFSYKNLIVCSDSPDDAYFTQLSTHIDFKLYRGSPINQFNFIMNSERYIVAPSTFSFWSSFVGSVSEVYWPNIWALENNETQYDWFPSTDSRYIKIMI